MPPKGSLSQAKLTTIFKISDLPEQTQEYIDEDIFISPKKYVVSVANKEYNKKGSSPFERALNKIFEIIKSTIQKHELIEKN